MPRTKSREMAFTPLRGHKLPRFTAFGCFGRSKARSQREALLHSVFTGPYVLWYKMTHAVFDQFARRTE